MKRFRIILMSAILSLSMCYTCLAAELSIRVTLQDKANESGMLRECNCDYCKKIEEFFEGEQDAQKRELSVQVWKAAIHPELFADAGNAVYVGTFPNADNLRYTALTLGLSPGWPRCREDDGALKVYMPPSSGPAVMQSWRYIDEIYQSVTEVQQQMVGKSDVDCLQVLMDYIKDRVQYSDEYIDGYPISKLSTVYDTRKACCVGYSTLFKLIGQMCGYTINYVGNDVHMFVEVNLDGTSKYCDLAAQGDTNGTYFLFGDDMLSGIYQITKR